jgi:endonuclease I
MRHFSRNMLCLALMATFAVFYSSADIPSGYYSSLTGKYGQSLKDALHDIIRPHTQLTYNSLWGYFPETDVYPDLVNGKSRVWDMYSSDFYYYNGGTSGMNREHSFPKSWWGGSVVEAYTDLNHLYPADGPANTAKSNYPLGEVSTATFDNGVTKVGYAVSGEGGGASYVFEPADQYKGDFARTYFYMVTCYQDYTWRYTYMATNSTYLSLTNWAINLLLKWSREDPVSDKEKNRNEAVYKIQNNRNPFIDQPDLIEYIWGNKAGQSYNGGSDTTTTGSPELITPTQNTELKFGDVAVGKSVDLVLYVKGRNLTNNLTVQLYKDDYKMFSSSVTSIDRTAAMTGDGYKLTLTYTPTDTGSHKAKLLILDGGLVGSIGVYLSGRCLPVPSLSKVKALDAQNITDSSYVATWEPSTDVIDYYLVNRKVYDANNNIVTNDSFNVDAEETSLQLNDLVKGQTHTYTVRTSRLGYTSDESNVITVTSSGITGINADRPLALAAVDGGVRIMCSEPLHNVRVYTTGGELVKQYPVISNDAVIYLPMGVYVLTSSSSTHPAKVVVKD